MNRVTIILEIEVSEKEAQRILPKINEYVMPSIGIEGKIAQAVAPVQITRIDEERDTPGYYAPSAYSNGNPIEIIPPSYHRKIYLS